VKHIFHRIAGIGLCLGLLPALQGCLPLLAGLPFVGDSNQRYVMGHLGSRTKVKIKSVSFTASNDANLDSPTEIHLVLLNDPHMIAEMLQLSAAQYFKGGYWRQLKQNHTSTLHIYKYQIPPGGQQSIKPDTSGTIVAGFIFANYKTPGDHRIRISEERNLLVMLEKKDWKVIPHEGED
jgi:type VI secretion system protein